jgi:hypothetical protein
MTMQVDEVIQYSGPLGDMLLIAVLGVRRRWNLYPAFTFLIAFDLISTIVNLATNFTSRVLAYSVYDAFCIIIQIFVISELLRHVLPRDSKLATRGRQIFVRVSGIGLFCAGGAALLFNPPRMHGATLYESKLDIFAGLLICETVIAIMLAAQQVGLGWKNHLIAVAQGLMLWALLLVFIEGLGPYLNFHNSVYDKLYYVRSLTYIGLLGYWSVALWREEPARKPISPALRKYIVALHDQVNYDLGKTGH